MTTRSNIFQAIDVERKYQDDLWGPLEQQNNRDLLCWMRCLKEEVLEANAEIRHQSPRNFHHELVQIAAVAIACLEQQGEPDLLFNYSTMRSQPK